MHSRFRFRTSAFSTAERGRASKLLMDSGFLNGLQEEEARILSDYIRPKRIDTGTVFYQSGQRDTEQTMAIILSGEVTVGTADGDYILSVLGPGRIIGEMSLLDRAARSANCTAASPLALGLLSREALERMVREQPALAARVFNAIAIHLAEHLRQTNNKLVRTLQVGKVIQQELDATHAINRRLLKERDAQPGSRPRSGPAAGPA